MSDEPNGTPIPTPEGDEVWDAIEAQDAEETVEVTKQELEELGEFLAGIRQLVLAHESRLTLVEQFLAEVVGAANEMEASEGEGTDQEVPSGGFTPTIIDGGGESTDAGGTDVPEQNA